MSESEDEEVVLRFVHTADWHLGQRFMSFAEKDRQRLTRARLDSVDQIFGLANQQRAEAVLCAGDLFDGPDPAEVWWEGLVKKLAKQPSSRPIFLLPGNHDPLTAGSVWESHHPFRRALPDFVRVVDRDDFEEEFFPGAVLYAVPCRSVFGQEDPTRLIPARQPGDERIRIGMVHGSTFDIPQRQANFPIGREAARHKGLDYLAVGDHHGYRVVEDPPPSVYPGTPEPTCFGESDPGTACVVKVRKPRQAKPERHSVAFWTWEKAHCHTLAELRGLRDGPSRLQHVVQLSLDMQLTAPEYQEAERILRELEGSEAQVGRIGILRTDRSGLRLDSSNMAELLADLPPILQRTAERLRQLEHGEQAEEARQALLHLYGVLKGGN